MIRRLVQLVHAGACAAARQGWSLEPRVLLVPCGGSDGCGDLEGSFGAARSNSRESSNFSRRLRRASRFFESTGLRGTAAARHLDSTGQFAFCSRARKIQRLKRAQSPQHSNSTRGVPARSPRGARNNAGALRHRRARAKYRRAPSPRKIQTRAIAAPPHTREPPPAGRPRCSGSTSTVPMP